MSKTLFVGDLHSDWGSLNQLINKQNPTNIIQVGDFGWWPHFHGKKTFSKNKTFNQFGIKNKETNVYWIGGNHENWDDLYCITDNTPIEIQDKVIYCPFGTILEVNGLNILCCGGAESIDKQYRIEGVSWWRNELICQKDMDNLPDCHVDMIISHTIPTLFFQYKKILNMGKNNDPSVKALQMIMDKYCPKYWVSGHFHTYLDQKIQTSYGSCRWISLAMPKINDTWWINFNKVIND